MNSKDVQRMCFVCRTKKTKSELIRIVNQNGELKIDNAKILQGKGAYICNDAKCIEDMMKKHSLNRLYKCNIDEKIYQKLNEDIDARR